MLRIDCTKYTATPLQVVRDVEPVMGTCFICFRLVHLKSIISSFRNYENQDSPRHEDMNFRRYTNSKYELY